MEKVVPFRTGYGSGLCAAWYDGSFLFVLFTLTSGADGHVSGTVDYDVFGKPVTETGVFAGSAGGSGGISALVFAYAGKPYDPVTGLSDYGFRDYSPSLARFTTIDPIRDGSNWYAYCNSDPVNYVDAWGLAINDIKSTSKGTTTDLRDIIDTPAFAQTICSNSQYLDGSTKNYADNAGPQSIEGDLNKITVITGVDSSTVDKYAKELGLNMKPSDGDAFSIGGYIFIFEEKFNTTDPGNRYLLKHEAVHYIQSIAEGGTASFLTKYVDSVNTNGYYDSEYEKAAYSFGPKNKDAKSYYKDAVGSKTAYIK